LTGYTPREVWFGDQPRVGQKNRITRRSAKRGTRPSAPRDQRTASTYIFGAICPAEGKAVGLILPWCNTEAMNLHLAAISVEVASGRHAALLLDQAGWHLTPRLIARQHQHRAAAREVPRVEPAGEHLAVHARQLALQSDLHLLREHRRPLLRRLEQARPPTWTIMSIGLCDWAHGF
jgi:hypothetical protein